jgi:glutathione S-transferase
MLALYFAPGSSSMAPHIALHEIGAPFDARPLSLSKKENQAPAYLALNPEGKVPTLLVDERPLTEVAAILLYLARRFPEANLLPADDLEAEAQAVSWMSFIASTIHWGARGGKENGQAAFGIADRRLAGREWAMGRYSIADIHLFRLYWRFRELIGATPGQFPNLDAHYARMMARPAVQRTCEIESAIGYTLPVMQPASGGPPRA